MSHVHLLPVGLDIERLFLPLSRGELPVDRVVLYRSDPAAVNRAAADIAADAFDRTDAFDRVAYTVETVLDHPVEVRCIDDVTDYRGAYLRAYEDITTIVERGDTVHVNISSMPRTVAFAFATAADAVVTESPSLRERVDPYYVTPDTYLTTRILDALAADREAFAELDEERASERVDAIDGLLSEVRECGLTRGARDVVHLPSAPHADLREFERALLRHLADHGPAESTSALARGFAEARGRHMDESLRSKVQYNVGRLEEKGYVERVDGERGYVTQLSTMGDLWAETH